ncbi:MAG: hypothetical protein K2M30_02435, partial [Desulfovibrionaceae bacterium]|nr:hypothetical protein [Desulfovibrionaceae bacterium]
MPDYLYVQESGLCNILSLTHLAIYSLYGPEQGKTHFNNILQNMKKAVNLADDEARQYLTAFYSLNHDTQCLPKESNEIPQENMPSQRLYTKNSEWKLSLKDVAELVFNPNFCPDEETQCFLLAEKYLDQPGLHATSIFRVAKKDEDTGNLDISIHFFEPNFGFIEATDKKAFQQVLIETEKKRSLLQLIPISLHKFLSYRSRFGVHVIDLLADRILNNPNMKVDIHTDPKEVTIKRHRANVYNIIQSPERMVLEYLYLLQQQLKSIEQIAQAYGVPMPEICLEEGCQPISIDELGRIYQTLYHEKAFEEIIVTDTFDTKELSHRMARYILEDQTPFYSFILSLTLSVLLGLSNINSSMPSEESEPNILSYTKEQILTTLTSII